jgi:alcohol dehydrogenase class IV
MSKRDVIYSGHCVRLLLPHVVSTVATQSEKRYDEIDVE